MDRMPAWADAVLVPLISILLAALLSALVILAIGESPVEALLLMVDGALMRSTGWGYTLYYATNFIFTGLCVAIAFHASLFNIGGEGQAMIGGLGVALVCLFIPFPHWSIALLVATGAAALFGAGWALRRRHGSGHGALSRRHPSAQLSRHVRHGGQSAVPRIPRQCQLLSGGAGLSGGVAADLAHPARL